MNNQTEFTKYEKLLIFGTENSGKSTLSYYLEKNQYKDQSPSTECKYIFL